MTTPWERTAANPDLAVTSDLQRLEGWAVTARYKNASANAALRMAESYAAAVLVPICGKAIQTLGTSGFEPDGFMLQTGSFMFAPRFPIRSATIQGWMPEQHGAEVTVQAACEGFTASQTFAAASTFTLTLEVDLAAGREHRMLITLARSFQPSNGRGQSDDTRKLGCIIQCVEFA